MKRFSRGIYKSKTQLAAMREPGRITALALQAVREAIRPGISTLELDAIAESVIRDHGAVPNFQLEPGYKHTICANVNDVLVHGIPNSTPLQPGDLVTIDCGAKFEGFNGDAAFSIVIPGGDEKVMAARQALSDATRHAMLTGVATLAKARLLGEVSGAIEDAILDNTKYGIDEDYVGHGIGKKMHEAPYVFNHRSGDPGKAVQPGLCVCIEPIIHTTRDTSATVDDDGWTVRNARGADTCQWEHAVAVHSGGIWVLTALDGGAEELAPFGIVPVPIPTP